MILYRAFAPVEVPVDGDGLTVIGLAAPYDEVVEVDDGDGPYLEAFTRGAFAGVVDRWPARRLKVQLEHPTRAGMGAWVGRGEAWRDGPDGLHVELRLDDTTDGRAAAFKVRDGQTPAMSVAYTPGRTERRWNEERGADVHYRSAVRAINHVALVPAGAYPSALVTAHRAAGVDGLPSTVELGALPPPPAPRPRLAELDGWLATMRGDSPPDGPPPG